MKLQTILLLLVISLFACEQSTNSLLGKWNVSGQQQLPFDTLGIEDDFDTGFTTYEINTDSGRFTLATKNDSIISITPSNLATIAEFHFDDPTHGMLSFYELDTVANIKILNNDESDYRIYSENINFTLYKQGNRTFILTDHEFNQFGRFIDTSEYRFLNNNEVEIFDKIKLKRRNEP